jgi:hypothetical protein
MPQAICKNTTPTKLNAIALPLQMPDTFEELRAYYWTLQRLANTLIDAFNQPLAGPIGGTVEDWIEMIRQGQGRVVDALRDAPAAHRGQKLDALLHWAAECGDSPSARLKVISAVMAEGEEMAA